MIAVESVDALARDWTYRRSADCHVGIAMPRDTSFSFDKAANFGRDARSPASLIVMSRMGASGLPTMAASSRARPDQVVQPVFTQWYRPDRSLASISALVACTTSST